VKRSVGCGVLILLLAACTAPPKRPTVQKPTADTVEGLAAAIAADAERSDRESDSNVRDELATQASRDAEACLARDPQAAACLYGHAVALGLQAKAHPTRAGESLKNMLEALTRAEAADPNYDHAGPARVRALVLVRAPGWPLGPGDGDAGLLAARRAVALQPQYPPNLLALAEALAKTGDANGARETYGRARDAAQALPATAGRDDWLRAADQGLQHR
jgi:hypothetical protein